MSPEQQAQTFQAAYHARLSKEIGDAHLERIAQEVRAGLAETAMAQERAANVQLHALLQNAEEELKTLRPAPEEEVPDEATLREVPDEATLREVPLSDRRKPRPRDEDLRAPHDDPAAPHKAAPTARSRRK